MDGSLEGGHDAQVDLVDALRRQVEVQAVGNIQATGQVNGFRSANLVKPGKIVLGYLGKDRGRRFPVRAAHQGFE